MDHCLLCFGAGTVIDRADAIAEMTCPLCQGTGKEPAMHPDTRLMPAETGHEDAAERRWRAEMADMARLDDMTPRGGGMPAWLLLLIGAAIGLLVGWLL